MRVRVSLVYATEDTRGLRGAGIRYQPPVDVDVDVPHTSSDLILDYVFDIFNRHDSPTQHEALDRLGLRSLSVGDIVVLGDEAWRCVSLGWDKVLEILYDGAAV